MALHSLRAPAQVSRHGPSNGEGDNSGHAGQAPPTPCRQQLSDPAGSARPPCSRGMEARRGDSD